MNWDKLSNKFIFIHIVKILLFCPTDYNQSDLFPVNSKKSISYYNQ